MNKTREQEAQHQLRSLWSSFFRNAKGYGAQRVAFWKSTNKVAEIFEDDGLSWAYEAKAWMSDDGEIEGAERVILKDTLDRGELNSKLQYVRDMAAVWKLRTNEAQYAVLEEGCNALIKMCTLPPEDEKGFLPIGGVRKTLQYAITNSSPRHPFLRLV